MRNMINKGFTLTEVTIVLIVMTIVSTMVIPDVVTFLQHYESRSEKEALFEIKRALKAYADDWGVLPAEATWIQDISQYSDLSLNQIEFDMWGGTHQYRMFTYPYTTALAEEFRGQEFTADYAMVMSYGVDALIDPATVLVDSPVVNVAFTGLLDSLVPLTPDLPLGPMEPLPVDARDVYSSLSTGGDDQLIVFTNLPQMVVNMKVTKERIATIQAAVDNYAAGLKSLDPTPTTALYRPPSREIPGPPVDADANYDLDVQAAADAFLGPGPSIRFDTTQANNNQRRAGMIDLMRFLGLTDSYCCNAMERYNDAGTSREVPLFYYSNPRGTDVPAPICNAAHPAGPATNTPFLPVRVLRERGELNPLELDNCG
jgi:prepilin-type N-terminal cleavage/methylation domain-containing protein